MGNLVKYQLLKDWEKIDTTSISTLSDGKLLAMISELDIRHGYGLIVELMKRFSNVKN